ncbi:MAG: tetratricopeptide repeat protein, partial [Planctomycetota bacterium]
AWRSPEGVLMLMKRAPARAQLDFTERLIRMAGAKEKRAGDLDRRAKELARDKRDGLARELRGESSRLRNGAERLYRQSSSALMEAETVLAPDDTRLLSTRGLVALRQQEFRRARDLLEKAVDGMPPGPERAEVLVRLGGAWEGIGDRSEAVKRYERAAEEAPDDPAPLVFLGMARRMSGQFAKALAALRRATELRPDDAELQHRLGLIFMDMLMLKEAEVALLRAREAAPSNERYRDDLDTVRRLLKGQKDPGKAREAFAEGEMLEARATEALTEGDEDQAIRMLISAADAYRRAIAYAQHNHAAHYRRGVCLAMYGAVARKYDAKRDLLGEAIGHFETALLYAPGNEDYLFAFALARQDLGKTKDAETSYRELLTLNPNSARAHYQLAKLYAYHSNDPARARDELEKALRLGHEPEPEFVENLEDIEYGPHTQEENAAEAAAQSASSEAEISLGIEGPAAAAAAYARAHDALAGVSRPLIVRKRAGAAALAARCWEQAKDPAKALEWYKKAAAAYAKIHDVLAGHELPLASRRQAHAAAQAAACWEHAKDLAKSLKWYRKAAALDPGPYDADVARVGKLVGETGAGPRE